MNLTIHVCPERDSDNTCPPDVLLVPDGDALRIELSDPPRAVVLRLADVRRALAVAGAMTGTEDDE